MQAHDRLTGCLAEHLDRDIVEALCNDVQIEGQQLLPYVEKEWLAGGNELLKSLELPTADHIKILGHGNSCVVLQGRFKKEEVVSDLTILDEHLRP